jgi:hypothetical protein
MAFHPMNCSGKLVMVASEAPNLKIFARVKVEDLSPIQFFVFVPEN